MDFYETASYDGCKICNHGTVIINRHTVQDTSGKTYIIRTNLFDSFSNINENGSIITTLLKIDKIVDKIYFNSSCTFN